MEKTSSPTDKSPELINQPLLMVIPAAGCTGYNKHPLSLGFPPPWAEGWGETSAYGPFVEVSSLRFLWHPDGFWFCEVSSVDGEPLPKEKMREIGATFVDSEQQAQQIRNYSGYKNRVAN